MARSKPGAARRQRRRCDMRPLLTFAIPAYNQEQFITEAVQGALSQTYSPLEIILSDDGSRDRTFQIMKEMAASYRGPHKIILNRNGPNAGLAAHVNRIMELAQGELVLAGAGDDVSLPERAAVLFAAWDSTGRRAAYLHSRVLHIDEKGNRIVHPNWEFAGESSNAAEAQRTTPSRYVRTLHPGVLGCSGAWVPSVFKVFGALPWNVVHEDNVIAFRAVLLSELLFVDQALVKYRLHEHNLYNARHEIAATWESIQAQERRLQRDFTIRSTMHSAFCQDLETAHGKKMVSNEEFSLALASARHFERLFSLQSAFLTANPVRKVPMLFQLARAGVGVAQLGKLSIRLVPGPVFCSAKVVRGWLGRMKNWRRRPLVSRSL